MLNTCTAKVAAASDAGRPYLTIGWRPGYDPSANRFSVFIESRRSGDVLACIAQNRRIAVTVGDPLTYRSFQFKGTDCAEHPLQAGDEEAVEQHRQGVASALALTGDPLTGFRNYGIAGLVRIEFTVVSAYDQTPGPNAGMPV